MSRGFVLPIIILLFIAGATYFIYAKYSKSPNEKTIQTAKTIYKYPNNITWGIKPRQNICVNPKEPCAQPADIILTTNDPWSQIYNYYKSYLVDYGWSTNSTVYTSIPTGIEFEKESCKLFLRPKENVNFLSDKTSKPPYQFVFTVTCQQS